MKSGSCIFKGEILKKAEKIECRWWLETRRSVRLLLRRLLQVKALKLAFRLKQKSFDLRYARKTVRILPNYFQLPATFLISLSRNKLSDIA